MDIIVNMINIFIGIMLLGLAVSAAVHKMSMLIILGLAIAGVMVWFAPLAFKISDKARSIPWVKKAVQDHDDYVQRKKLGYSKPSKILNIMSLPYGGYEAGGKYPLGYVPDYSGGRCAVCSRDMNRYGVTCSECGHYVHEACAVNVTGAPVCLDCYNGNTFIPESAGGDVSEDYYYDET